MAQLRGDSKCGGKPIVTLDMLDQVVDDILNVSLETKLNKKESNIIINSQDELIKDSSKNGIYPTNLSKITDGLEGAYHSGTLSSFSTSESRFQIYAPYKQEDASSLFFRTGWGNDIKKWERVSTKSMMDKELDKKFDKTGGDITGSIHISNSASIQNKLYVKNDLRIDNYLKLGINEYGKLYTDTSKTSLFFKDNALHIYEDELVFNDQNVWHTGNLDTSIFLKKPIKLPVGTDLMTVINTGFYTCLVTKGTEFNVGDKTYIEVIAHDSDNILQKVYSFDGSKIITRTKHEGIWTNWRTVGRSVSYMQEISENQWNHVDGLYEYVMNHNMGSDNITSVIITDSNKVSVFSGFQIMNGNITKVFSNTAITGKIIIHATT